jgi:L,D-peptidoglycan transpeptidase YkuD (ErfK/YbiS/YcfS/YnhG family)
LTGRRRRALAARTRGGVAAAVAVVLAVIVGAFIASGRSAPAREAAPEPLASEAPYPTSADSSTPASAPSSASPSASRPSASRSGTPGATAAGAGQGNAASRLRSLPAATRQVIVVSSDGYGSTTATFEAFNKINGGWQPAFGAMTARVGSKGFADRKVEGDLKTPTGVYPIGGTMYGIAANPGVRYGYHRLVPDDWWNENPATPGYNSFFHGTNPGGASEALWEISPQYDYFAVINYNIPVVVADPPRGSGIFLHVAVPGRATAGCVALAVGDLLTILRWLDPAASPRMVLGPRSALTRY